MVRSFRCWQLKLLFVANVMAYNLRLCFLCVFWAEQSWNGYPRATLGHTRIRGLIASCYFLSSKEKAWIISLVNTFDKSSSFLPISNFLFTKKLFNLYSLFFKWVQLDESISVLVLCRVMDYGTAFYVVVVVDIWQFFCWTVLERFWFGDCITQLSNTTENIEWTCRCGTWQRIMHKNL